MKGTLPCYTKIYLNECYINLFILIFLTVTSLRKSHTHNKKVKYEGNSVCKFHFNFCCESAVLISCFHVQFTDSLVNNWS